MVVGMQVCLPCNCEERKMKKRRM
uniref:Uncharacterized protein n=1 Tax=Arundo donax TaxID=35708 RepID=A0A0A9BPW1_ARUDO